MHSSEILISLLVAVAVLATVFTLNGLYHTLLLIWRGILRGSSIIAKIAWTVFQLR